MEDNDPLLQHAADSQTLREFVSELEAAGFQRTSVTEWQGPTRTSLIEAGFTTSPTMTVIIRANWPYLPPLLNVPEIAAWHADQERLCIWQAEDSSQRWKTLQGLYERIDEWVAQAKLGFDEVENARNPEIYWEETEAGAIVALVDIEDLVGPDRADGQHVEFHFKDAVSPDGRRSPVIVMDLDSGPFTPSTSLPEFISGYQHARGRIFIRTAVPHPPRTLKELTSFLTTNQRSRLEKDLRDRPYLMFGLAWPNKAGLVATILFATPPFEGQPRSFYLVALKPKSRSELLLRAGVDAVVVQSKKVVLFGLGAIGSHVADLLVRSGLAELQAIDYDAVWPANLIRHALPPGTPAGTLKTRGLQAFLQQYPWTSVEVPADPLSRGNAWNRTVVEEALADADLAIDATGHGGLAEFIARSAARCATPFISVALFRGGRVVRVRRQAHSADTPIIQRAHLDRYPTIEPLADEVEYVGTEIGCLARVHNAPPTSVVHAAVLAVEVALDLLTARNEYDDEVIEVLRGGDPPFDRLGRLDAASLAVHLDLAESAEAVIREAIKGSPMTETGGVLLGVTVDERTFIAEAIMVPDEMASERRYSIPSNRVIEIVETARQRDGRLGYVGEWHSHLEDADPSDTDIETMLGRAKDSGFPAPVLILGYPNAADDSDLAAFVVTSDGLRRATCVSTGDLPPNELSAS